MQAEALELKDKLSKLLIPKLDEQNFPSWSSRMRAYLRSKDYWKFISGKKATIANKKKADASNIIISHLGDIVFDAVVTLSNKNDPRLLWNAIVEPFASDLINNKARIWLKFMRYEYSGNLHTYLIDCQKMVKELFIVKLGIPDDIISISILAKLSKDYWNVVDNLIMNKPSLTPSRTLRKLQELVFMKETCSSSSKVTDSHPKPKDKGVSAFKADSKSKYKKPKNPCDPGKHNPLAYHPAWRCFKLS
jgi:hypothetical protein